MIDKKARHDLYRFSVGPGWWPILDRVLPRIWDVDPDCELYIKEKYGLLRMDIWSEKFSVDQHIEIENAAELASSKICESCGRPGKLRTDRGWLLTLCDRCNADEKARGKAMEETEQRWLDSEKVYFFLAPPTGLDMGEECLRQDIVAEEAGECYLCDGHIDAGNEATLLISIDDMAPPSELDARYLLHRACADKSCRKEQRYWEE